MSEEEAYSQLSASDESVIISTLLICAVGTTLAFIILFSLCFRKNERDHPRAFTFAVLSVICSIFAYMTVLLWGNNLLIHWKFDGKHQTFVSLSDGFFMVFYTFSKITFWCSWTYHVLNMCDANHDSTTRKYLTAWMIIGCVRLSTGMIGFLVDDVSEEQLQEIGVSSMHNIYVTMFPGHEGAKFAHYCAMFGGVVDMIYFIVLIYCYIKELRRIANDNREDNRGEVKGVVVLCATGALFWVVCMFVSSGSVLAWFAPIDFISDDICLFLMCHV
eukprot:917717_1